MKRISGLPPGLCWQALRTPEDLHWARPTYEDAVRHAREIRNRYTFLYLAADSGQLDRMVPTI